MSPNAHLALDLGAESGRAILGVLKDEQLKLHELHRFANLPQQLNTGSHWDLDALWANVKESVRRASSFASDNDLNLVSVGVDSWGCDYGLIDADGAIIEPPHCYRDERNAAAYAKTIDAIGKEVIYETTGIQFMRFNALYQLVAAQDADPGILSRADKLLFIADLMHYLFTGSAVVESSLASTSQMIDARSGSWADSIIEAASLPRHMLGEIVSAATNFGSLRDDLALELGLKDSLSVIVPAAHDTGSAVAAVPADENSDWCYISNGTWSPLGAELHEPVLTEKARAASFTNEGGVAGTIRFLKNITGLWLVQQCRKEFSESGSLFDYETLTELATKAQQFQTIVDPAYGPFGTPGGMLEKIDQFAIATKQPAPTNPGEYVRCCLESLALACRYTLDLLEDVLARRFEVVHVVGGGARNLLLNQMIANATGRTVIVGPIEAAAIGNILVQAMGSGAINDVSHLRRIVSLSFEPQTYKPQDSNAWEAAYKRFSDLREATAVAE